VERARSQNNRNVKGKGQKLYWVLGGERTSAGEASRKRKIRERPIFFGGLLRILFGRVRRQELVRRISSSGLLRRQNGNSETA
jgi:hypothetical protein